MDGQKTMLQLWLEAQKEKEKEIAYAFSDRDKKHILAEVFAKAIAELWKLEKPKFTVKKANEIVKKYPDLKEFPQDLAFCLYYSVKSAEFLWGALGVKYPPHADPTDILNAYPGYQKAKEEFEKKYGSKEDKSK